MGKFVKGESGNRRVRPAGQSPGRVVLWDLKQAARAHCIEALQVVLRCLHSDDDRVALKAAEILFERYGTHRFVVASQTMPLDRWLASKGQPEPDSDPEKGYRETPGGPERKLN
jgi:hypothetical protein